MSDRRCEAWVVSSRFDRTYCCPHRARYRVIGNKRRDNERDTVPMQGEYVCGRHVRPALMDNGDSVWKPWTITRLTDG